MRPLEHSKDQSSESDEDSNIRHDRFRSERFNNNITSGLPHRVREENYTRNERFNCSRHRDRSPIRSQRQRGSTTSSYRNESKSNHERNDKECHSKHHKSGKSEKSVHDMKILDSCEQKEVTRTNKNKLSSLLKNFDKQLESKRNSSEKPPEIGPELPRHLKDGLEILKEPEVTLLLTEEVTLDPKLPPHLKTACDNAEIDCSKKDDDNAFVYCSKSNVTSSESHIEKSKTESLVLEDRGVLPLHLNNSQKIEENAKSEIIFSENTTSNSLSLKNGQDSLENDSFGSPLPTKPEPEIYGPALPPKVKPDSYGPALPPNFKKDIQGPSFHFDSTTATQHIQEESDDEEIVGPMPDGTFSITQYQLDLRAMQIKRKLEEQKSGSSKEIKKREEWMLELPPEKSSNLGLGPRSFRMREAPDMSNRSSWTDSPADKLRKEEQALRGEEEPVKSEEMMRTAFIKERDQAMDKMSQQSREEDRSHSLLDLHQKKLKKKKKKEEKKGKKQERRPFDRNIDLQVNRFDEAQKKAIFKKAQLLDTRFSTGESKYL